MASNQHPAFYHSKKVIWDYPISSPPDNSKHSWKRLLNTICIGSFDRLWKFWYVIFLWVSTCWLFWLAVRRYLEFKSQVSNPRFGNDWNYLFPMNFQIFCLVLIASLFPMMLYAAMSRVGHAANDCILLGRDCLHLQAMLAISHFSQFTRKAITGNCSAISSGIKQGDRLQPPQINSSTSFNEPDLEAFLIKKNKHACCSFPQRQLRPFSGILHVIISFAFVIPVIVFEAEQIRNEAINPNKVWQSNLDWFIKGFSSTSSLPFPQNSAHRHSFTRLESQVIVSESVKPQSKSSFEIHPYPSQPRDIAIEYVGLASSLVILTIRYAAPFWFTSRTFSILFSLYTAVTGLYILLEAAAVELLVKILVAGSREASSERIDVVPIELQILDPWYCVITSCATIPLLLVGLITFYALGEQLFKQAVNNYANLVIKGEFDSSKQLKSLHDLSADDRQSQASVHFSSPHTAENNSMIGLSRVSRILAVTTKPWRAPPSQLSQQSTVSVGIATGNNLLAQSATSDLSGTIYSNKNDNQELDGARNTKKLKSKVVFGPIVLSGISFICLLVTRALLFGPMIQCYWFANIGLTLAFVIISIVYLILWMVLWLVVSVKTAWRFRFLHIPPSFNATSRQTSQKYKTDRNNYHFGSPKFPPWPLVNNSEFNRMEGTYFWPWLQYQPGLIQHGSNMTYSISPTPYDETQLNPSRELYRNIGVEERVTPAVDSVYGCFTGIDPLTESIHHASSGGLIRGGPSIHSDQYDNALPVDLHRHNTHFVSPNEAARMCQSASNSQLTNYAYLQQSNINLIHQNSEYTESQSMKASPCEMTSFELNNTSNDTQPHSVFPSIGMEPSYATLASLSKKPCANSNYINQLQSNQSLATRRLPTTRVTFKEHSKNISEDDVFVENGVSQNNNESSDSGVCTNESNITNIRPSTVGKLNIANYPLFTIKDSSQKSYGNETSPRGFAQAASSVYLETDERLCSQV